MAEFVAMLVEDATSDRAQTSSALRDAGFTVIEFSDASSALVGLREERRPVDLIVLDRRLPLKIGDVASDEVGDDLLNSVIALCPDQKIIVFSGHSGESHIQFAQSDRGVIELRAGDVSFDRVTALTKGQSLEFDQRVRSVRDCLQAIADIQVTTSDDMTEIDPLNKRIIRRAAYEFEAVSVQVRPLAGGASAAPVWLCEMHSTHDVVARAVIKVQRRRAKPGGFQSILPAPMLAGVVDTFGGFCAGRFVSVQQVASSDPVALMTLVETDAGAAAEVARDLRNSLDSLPPGQRANVAIEEVMKPFGEWSDISAWAQDHDIDLPSPSKICSTTLRLQHGDLHPGNVLVVDGRPVLIDFDRQCHASSLLDPVVLALSPLFHPASTVRDGDWPTEEQVASFRTSAFLVGCPYHPFATEAMEWLESRATSPLELYAMILGYSLRQLRYPDIQESANYTNRVVALARWAVAQLLAD